MAPSKNLLSLAVLAAALPLAAVSCDSSEGNSESLVDKGSGAGAPNTGGGAGALVFATGGRDSGVAGGSSTGGGTSMGGVASDGAAGAGACTAVTFHMDNGGPAPGSRFCSGPPNCAAGFPLTVRDDTGRAMTLELACAQADCSTCQAAPCPPGSCHVSSPLPAAGQDIEWTGLQYFGGGTCSPTGGGPALCYTPQCAPAGHYVAHLCAYALPSNSDGGTRVCELHASATATCVDVPFDYPTTTKVVGVLDPRK